MNPALDLKVGLAHFNCMLRESRASRCLWRHLLITLSRNHLAQQTHPEIKTERRRCLQDVDKEPSAPGAPVD